MSVAAPDGLKLGEDFPFICEVCLGPNPYLRMIKMPMARECKISGRPYTAFRWQPGSEARYKETIIAAEVAIAKNVCQVCLMDMEYNLPVAVRDRLMGKGGAAGSSTGTDGGGGTVSEPSSDVNKEFFWENQRKLLEEGTLQGYHAGGAGGAGGKMVSQSFEKLSALSRSGASNPYYDRNLPKLCSFWCLQTCNRVVNSACPYRPCNGTFRFPELASSHQDRLSTLVRKLHADGAVSVMRDTSSEMEEIRELLRDSQRGSRNDAIRARYHGTDDDKLAQKYLDRAQSMPELTPPRTRASAHCGWVGSLPMPRGWQRSASKTCTRNSMPTARSPTSRSCLRSDAPSSHTCFVRVPRRQLAGSTKSCVSTASRSSSGGQKDSPEVAAGEEDVVEASTRHRRQAACRRPASLGARSTRRWILHRWAPGQIAVK